MALNQWQYNYTSAEETARRIQESLRTLSNTSRNTAAFVKLAGRIRNDIKTVEDLINHLAVLLQEAVREPNVDPEQLHRQLNKLRSSLEQSKDQLHTASRSQRPEWNPASIQSAPPVETDETTLMSNEQLLQRQKQTIREQDKSLDALSDIVSRQKQMAIDIGNEVDVQNEMLDEIDDQMETVDRRLIRETRHAEVVGRKAQTCGLWIVIFLLFVVIIVIIAVPV